MTLSSTHLPMIHRHFEGSTLRWVWAIMWWPAWLLGRLVLYSTGKREAAHN